MELSATQVRVVGCLMEKQVTTPDLYPLTVNSLRSACNQSTNRHPVMDLSETDINAALISLREDKLTRIVYSTSNRAPKHRHTLDEALRLESGDQAVLTVLALRGAQTVGEIKGRTERMHPFRDLHQVEAVLEALAARPEPLVVRLGRRPGQKEERYMHLLGGPIDEAAFEDEPASTPRADRTTELQGRVDTLQAEVDGLESRVEELERIVGQLRTLLD
jgi:uncharacterized protein